MVNQKLPHWICNYITRAEIENLAKDIARLEEKTSVEIVTMTVQRSTAIGHVPWLLGLFLFVTILEVHGSFLALLPIEYQLPLHIVEVVVSLLLGYALTKISPTLQRMFTTDTDMAQQVNLRAQVEFHNNKLSDTSGRTGILIFVSFMEHRVVVLADKSVSDKFAANTWDEVVTNLILDLKQKQLARGLTKAVEHVSKLVTPQFPVQTNDSNELTNHLIIEGVDSGTSNKTGKSK